MLKAPFAYSISREEFYISVRRNPLRYLLRLYGAGTLLSIEWVGLTTCTAPSKHAGPRRGVPS